MEDILLDTDPEMFPELSNTRLAEAYADALDEQRSAMEQAGHLEQEIHARIDANGGRALTNDDGEVLVRRKPSKPEYDLAALVPLKEILSDAALAECWVAEWEKTTVIEAHWDFTKLNKHARDVGKPVTDVMDPARLPGKPGKLELVE